MGLNEKTNGGNGFPLTKSLSGLTNVVSDGFFGASYIPDQSGQQARNQELS
jgi:hypothetical protein